MRLNLELVVDGSRLTVVQSAVLLDCGSAIDINGHTADFSGLIPDDMAEYPIAKLEQLAALARRGQQLASGELRLKQEPTSKMKKRAK